MMKKRMRKRRGSISIVMIGITAAIMVFTLFFMELQTMFDYQYAIEVRAQRAINTTVEDAMDDEWRRDGYNFMDVTKAQNIYKNNLDADLNVNAEGECKGPDGKLLYRVTYGTPTFWSGQDGHEAGISIPVTVFMKAGLGVAFGKDGYTWTNRIESTNFRTDDNERAGKPLW